MTLVYCDCFFGYHINTNSYTDLISISTITSCTEIDFNSQDALAACVWDDSEIHQSLTQPRH